MVKLVHDDSQKLIPTIVSDANTPTFQLGQFEANTHSDPNYKG